MRACAHVRRNSRQAFHNRTALTGLEQPSQLIQHAAFLHRVTKVACDLFPRQGRGANEHARDDRDPERRDAIGLVGHRDVADLDVRHQDIARLRSDQDRLLTLREWRVDCEGHALARAEQAPRIRPDARVS